MPSVIDPRRGIMRVSVPSIHSSTLIISLGLLGCNPEQSPDVEKGACSIPEPGPAPIRRLTRVEYNNTVYQLLGDTSAPADQFPPDEEAGGFDNQAGVLVVSPLLAEHYMGAAEDLAA